MKTNKKTIVAVEITKGIAHAILIPYALLWLFQSFGMWAFLSSILYVAGVAIIYIKIVDKNKEKLSRFVFESILFAEAFFVLLVAMLWTFY